MSKNVPSVDRRVRRTRNRLAGAIIQLGTHQPIDSITVGELVRVAGIARSTFYAHFDGMADYLSRSFASMLEMGAQRSASRQGAENRLLAISDILAHIAHAGPYVDALRDSTYLPAMLAAGTRRLRATVWKNLQRLEPTGSDADRSVTATFVAGGFMSLLHEWMNGGMAEPPSQLERRFEARCEALLALHGKGQVGGRASPGR